MWTQKLKLFESVPKCVQTAFSLLALWAVVTEAVFVNNINFEFSSDQNFTEECCTCPVNNENSLLSNSDFAQCLLTGRKFSGTRQLPNDNLIPSWANLSMVDAGQKFAYNNKGFLTISHFFALIFENVIPDIKDVLIRTGSSNTRERAVKRYTATATQVVIWYTNSLNVPKERDIFLTSIRNVRRLHLDASFKAQKRFKKDIYLESMETMLQGQEPWSIINDEQFWTAVEKDLAVFRVSGEKRDFPDWWNNTGTPISQFAMTLTQFAFAGLTVLYYQDLGMTQTTQEELEAFVHLWAVIGHGLGIQEEYNICIHSNLDQAKIFFREIMDHYFIPALFEFDWRRRVQLGALLDALYHMNPLVTPRLIMFRFLRDILKIPAENLFQQMNAIERKNTGLMDVIVRDNLVANRLILNGGSKFVFDVSGFKNFGESYATDEGKSEGVFFTREKLIV